MLIKGTWVLVWVIGALVALNVVLTLPDRANGGITAIKFVALWLVNIAVMFAVVIVLIQRQVRRLVGGDLRAIDNHFVKRLGYVQDRRSPYVIEARSDTLDAALLVNYPWIVRAAKLEGYAQARFELGEDGVPRNIEIVQASHPLFSKSLHEALTQARGARRVSPSDEPREIRINFALQRDLHSEASAPL